MAQISVIVPVYNARAYLPACVESILGQTLRDLEVILVNDGSTDGSGELCDGFAARDPRVRVIHMENLGQTAARKAGTRLANGDYLSYVDSDDYLDPDFYGRMIEKSRKADLVITGYTKEAPGGSVFGENGAESGLYRGEKLMILQKTALYDPLKKRSGIIGALWCKLFSREFAREAFLSQEQELHMGEDMLFSMQMLLRARSVVIDNENRGYHYRIHPDSIMQSYNPRYFEQLNLLHDSLKKITLQLGAGSALANYYIPSFVDGVYHVLARSNPAPQGEKWDMVRTLAADPRLKDSLPRLDSKQPRQIRKTAGLLAQGKFGAFRRLYYGGAIRSRLGLGPKASKEGETSCD